MKLLDKSFLIITSVFLISCNTENQSIIKNKLNNISDDQKVLIRKIERMEESIKNLVSTNNNKQTNKKEPPKADPNKVYNIPIGDSFTKGPDDAAVTIIEWSDFQ